MARTHTPTKILKLRGSWRANRPEEPQPIAISTMPEPPPALTAEGRSHWAPLCESLLQMGVLTGADTALVVLLANTLGEYDAAAADLARDGRYVPTASGALRPHPAQYIMRAARIDALAMMRQLGLSPASRPALRTGGREHATSESDFFSMG